jgi:alpha-tubulin suppressor-like RCC1 family protein
MNITNIILQLQEKLKTQDQSLDLMTYAKMIEKLQVGTVTAVETFFDLPDPQDDGNIFLVESEDELYFNVGQEFRSLGKLIGDFTLAWGLNTNGRLGDGTTFNRSSPVSVIGGITNWASVSGGNYHSLGVTDSGIAYAWGGNGNGRLGDGTTTGRTSPVTVIGGITDWASVSASSGPAGNHSLGVTDTGIAYAWGYNNQGQLGDGTQFFDRSSPVTVIGGITNWASVSAGSGHSLGVTATGIAYAWGLNGYGQLGDGTTTNRSSPVTVTGFISNWAQVSGGQRHSLGVTATGIAYAWGLNTYGQLGNGGSGFYGYNAPLTVVGGITDWASVSAGDRHSLGVTVTGVAYAWGDNFRGQLGDGTSTQRSSPVTVIGGITDWASVSGGGYHSLGVTDAGIAYAWGNNNNGQLGNDTTFPDRSSPVTVIGGITDWAQVAAGRSHSLAIAADAKTFTK